MWTVFREEVQHLTRLMNLNTTKPKEVIIDFRTKRPFEHSVLCRRERVDWVESLHLTWSTDIAHQVKKAQ